jgi:hypothetical protein
VLYSSGSNIFGNSLANTQTFTGSLNVTGSQTIFGNLGIGAAADNTYQGITIYGSNPSLRLKGIGASAWNWIEFATSASVNNFSMGVNQTTPQFVIKAGAGLDSPNFTLSTAGVATFTGNVGIGTTSPSEKLEVLGPDGSVATIRWRNAGGRKSGYLYSDSGGISIYDTNLNDAGIYLAQNTQIDFRVSGSQRMLINSSGNVGIGTTSPVSPLHQVAGGGAYTGEARFGGSDSSFGLLLNYSQAGATSGSIYCSPGYSNASILFKLGAGSGNTNQLVLTGGGNVGIGTTSPTALLHLGVANAVVDGTKGVKITNLAGTTVMLECGVSSDSFVGTTSASDFSIKTSNAERMRITSAGNVTVLNLLSADRLSFYATGLYGKKVVKGDNVSSLAFDLSTLFPEMSSTFSTNVVGCFGMYTIFRGGAAETGMFSICRNSSITWSSAAYSVQIATGTPSISTVTGSGTTITMSFNTSVYVLVEVTAMIE